MRRFFPDNRGVAAIEFALVGPLFIALMLGTIEFGWLMFRTSQMGHVARDAARQFAIAQITTQAQAQTLATTQLGPQFVVGPPVNTTAPGGRQVVTVTITAQTADITFTPFFAAILGPQMVTRASMVRES